MSGQAADEEVETEPGDQQGAAASGRSREPLQGHHEPQAEGDRRPGAQLRQLQSATAQGAVGRTQLLR